jgi:hypothetical protein
MLRSAVVCGIAASASGFVLTGPAAVRPAGLLATSSVRSVRREGLQLRMAELTGIDKAKQLAGYKAVDDFVKSGELKDIICIPTSVATENQAKGLGIPLCTLNEKSRLDVAIDGADAVDPDLALVKGGGGALLREKMVEVMADKFICIVDDTKLCKGLGPSFALPVEITPFCHEHTLRTVAALPEVAGCTATLRMGQVSTGAKKDGDDIAVTGTFTDLPLSSSPSPSLSPVCLLSSGPRLLPLVHLFASLYPPHLPTASSLPAETPLTHATGGISHHRQRQLHC